MVTGALKNKIDAIRETVWTGGVSNPISVVEQITYLMFIHSLDELELQTEKMENLTGEKRPHIFPDSAAGQSMRWSRFKNKPAADIYRIVSRLCFPAIKAMKNGHLPDFDERGEVIPIAGEAADNGMEFSAFLQDAAFLIQDPMKLEKVITAMEDLFQHEFAQNKDELGNFYEYLLAQMSAAGELGQFRTPQHIRDMIVELVEPTPDDNICEKTLPTLIQTNETYESTQIDAFFESKPKIGAFLKIDANVQRQEYKMAS